MLNDHSIAACADYRVSYRCLHSYAAQIVMFSPQAVMQPAARNAFTARLVGIASCFRLRHSACSAQSLSSSLCFKGHPRHLKVIKRKGHQKAITSQSKGLSTSKAAAAAALSVSRRDTWMHATNAKQQISFGRIYVGCGAQPHAV